MSDDTSSHAEEIAELNKKYTYWQSYSPNGWAGSLWRTAMLRDIKRRLLKLTTPTP
jgi:hypothetical protein